MRNNARLVMLAQQSSSLGICHFTHARPPKTRLLHIYRKKKKLPTEWCDYVECLSEKSQEEQKLKLQGNIYLVNVTYIPMIKCVGVNFLAGFHKLPSSFMSALCHLQTLSGWARGVRSLRLKSVTLAITALRRREDGSFLERLICFYFVSPFHVPSSSIMQRKQFLLAWPKSLFRFVCKRVWKT